MGTNNFGVKYNPEKVRISPGELSMLQYGRLTEEALAKGEAFGKGHEMFNYGFAPVSAGEVKDNDILIRHLFKNPGEDVMTNLQTSIGMDLLPNIDPEKGYKVNVSEIGHRRQIKFDPVTGKRYIPMLTIEKKQADISLDTEFVQSLQGRYDHRRFSESDALAMALNQLATQAVAEAIQKAAPKPPLQWGSKSYLKNIQDMAAAAVGAGAGKEYYNNVDFPVEHSTLAAAVAAAAVAGALLVPGMWIRRKHTEAEYRYKPVKTILDNIAKYPLVISGNRINRNI